MTKKDKTQEPDVMIYVDENNKSTVKYNLKSGSVSTPISEESKKAVQEAALKLSKSFKAQKDEEIQVFDFSNSTNFSQIPEENRGGTNMAEAISQMIEVLKASRAETKVEDTNKKKPK